MLDTRHDYNSKKNAFSSFPFRVLSKGSSTALNHSHSHCLCDLIWPKKDVSWIPYLTSLSRLLDVTSSKQCHRSSAYCIKHLRVSIRAP